MEVKAPYNFVPLNTEVFFPQWANFISHDVPFKNQQSGKLELTITAESPIFIRGKEEKYPNDPEEKGWKQYRFPQFGNRYYIPGSSVRGMLAHQLEIISFGKLQHFNDDRHSYRDWENERLYKKSEFADNVCGWLYLNDLGEICIQGSQRIERITHQEIDNAVGTNFHDFFRGRRVNGAQFDEKKDEQKTAKFKYNRYTENEGSLKLKVSETITNDRRKIYKFDSSGVEKVLVLTGQSSKRNSNSRKGKHMEFLFPIFDSTLPANFKLSDEKNKPSDAYLDFIHTYKGSVDWEFWEEKLFNREPVPVFYKMKGEEVESLGLSMLYKVSYKKSIGDIIAEQSPKHIDPDTMDLTECIFGTISGEKALKGRVEISHAFSSNGREVNSNEPVIRTLGGPKSSYYPFYIEQTNINPNAREKGELKGGFNEKKKHTGTYKTYNDGVIAGRKKYPVKDWFTQGDNDTMSDTTTAFFPLTSGAEFRTTLYYHNLSPIELGALLSAITFHNSPQGRHQIGTGKALGYGKVQVEVDYGKSGFSKKEALSLMGCFEREMDQSNVANDRWCNSEQIRENLALSTPISFNEHIDAYLTLDPEGGNNEFSKLKSLLNQHIPQALPRFTDFMNLTNIKVESLAQHASNECDTWERSNNSNTDECAQILTAKLTEINQQLEKIAEHKKQEVIKQEALQEQQRIKEEELKRKEKIMKENQEFEDQARRKTLDSVISVLPNKFNPVKMAIDNLLVARNEPILPEQEHAVLIQKLELVYKESSNKARWENPYNNNIEKKSIANWVGKEKAEEIVDAIVQHNKST